MLSTSPSYLLPAWPTEDARLSLAQLSDYQNTGNSPAGTSVTATVQSLVKQGLVERSGGAWQLTESGKALWRQHPAIQERQANSSGTSTSGIPSKGQINSTAATGGDVFKTSPWDAFRRAVRYYIECVRLDERPSCALYADRKDEDFAFAYITQRWWPREPSDTTPVLRIPLASSQAGFMRKAIAENENEGLSVGYPVELGRIQQKGESTALLRPICCIPAVVEDYDDKGMALRLNFDELDVNSDWLQRGLTKDQQGAFLTATGMASKNEDSPDLPSRQSLNAVVAALNALLGDRMPGGALEASHTLSTLDLGKAKPGIHNVAVAYVGKRVKYSAGLLSELKQLAQATDACLDRTSLRPLFLGLRAVGDGAASDGETLPIAPFLPLNDEQERAVAAAANESVVVITGPPGTGKSQVGAALLANLAWHGKTAVFSTRNHKAIDAVVPRTNELAEGMPLVHRQTDPDTGVSFTWQQAVREMLATMSTAHRGGRLTEKTQTMQAILREQERLMSQAERWSTVESNLGRSGSEFSTEMDALSSSAKQEILSGSEETFRNLADELAALGPPSWLVDCTAWYGPVVQWIWFRYGGKGLLKKLRELTDRLKALGASLELSTRSVGQLANQHTDAVERLKLAARLRGMYDQVCALEEDARTLPPLAEIRGEISALRERVTQEGPQLLRAVIEHRRASLSQDERHRLQKMRGVLAHKHGEVFDQKTRLQWERFFQDEIGQLLRSFPVWAVTALSARRALPLGPGVVDVAVIDEASQCEIPAILPLLYRAKRAVIIGDPQQFRPVITLDPQKNRVLLRQYQLTNPDELIFDYRQFSIFDCAANAPFENIQHHLLRDHFRCHSSIATYCNDTFYNGELRVLTNPERLRVPSGRRPGIVWTDVAGEALPVRPSGATCPAEADAVCEQVAAMVEQGFAGTVGVISPFRRQADEIRMKMENRIPARRLREIGFVCSTAHAFQGGECDVVFFSPVMQPGLPDRCRWLLADAENRNLLNVSASRARAVLHIVGNREACMGSDIPHLVGLASPPGEPDAPVQGFFESPWERTLHDGLAESGIETVSQFPILGYRLDLAIPELRIDIEVDGERYHRDAATGRRKAEDLWRDLSLQGAGWLVVRFWVFELRENLDRCVELVRQTLRQRQEAGTEGEGCTV